ncbi:MAG: hypothetical protein JW839_10620 [Candidatus Lokiarchaeota archaeon]|nr:hypothetical protein [Candidatus Lokiarchaeota archaeon]
MPFDINLKTNATRPRGSEAGMTRNWIVNLNGYARAILIPRWRSERFSVQVRTIHIPACLLVSTIVHPIHDIPEISCQPTEFAPAWVNAAHRMLTPDVMMLEWFILEKA